MKLRLTKINLLFTEVEMMDTTSLKIVLNLITDYCSSWPTFGCMIPYMCILMLNDRTNQE